jgi:hypothetical protein
MAADSNRHWLLFAGGVILGSATAAGAAYALTSALISKQQQQQQYTDQQIQQVSQGRNRWVVHTCIRLSMLSVQSLYVQQPQRILTCVALFVQAR